MAPGVTVFCGVSGVGKTQFLNVLATHLLGRSTGDVSVSATDKDGEIIQRTNATVRCFHVDTARECFDTISQIARTRGLDEKREASDRAPLSEAWTSRLGYILNRDYDEASFQELDREATASTGSSTWHYYELTYRGITYGPHQMSLGELAASIVLRAFRSTQKSDIVLLDEPENFLSPQARKRLLDIIVEQTVEKKLSVVIASHSAEIIRNLPLASLRTIERGPQGARIAIATATSQAIRSVGLELRPDAVLLVEDNFAHRLLKAILARQLPTRHLDLTIVESGQDRGSKGGGEGAVVKMAQLLTENDIGVHVLGVLDGDYRGAKIKGNRNCLAFLPGTTCPEDFVIGTLESPIESAAATLGIPEETLAKALQTAEGADIHDRPDIISNATGVEVSELISYAARWLSRSPEYAEDLKALIDSILAILNDGDTAPA
ncbi:ATP-dependent nuclease [Nocardia transvalensis]|uniref:ATP-dependent nuclease n=1 Tax=Nocardia transvalensis TaxID=37333 RepID=UPI0018960127|nr:AAA family ATPase [Nocardia transvalensis]MBF6333301.1 AAA family ATPase [Nocardia transvalensis]